MASISSAKQSRGGQERIGFFIVDILNIVEVLGGMNIILFKLNYPVLVLGILTIE